jgi:hypothetical protein
MAIQKPLSLAGTNTYQPLGTNTYQPLGTNTYKTKMFGDAKTSNHENNPTST